jgi:hypothetical protein
MGGDSIADEFTAFAKMSSCPPEQRMPRHGQRQHTVKQVLQEVVPRDVSELMGKDDIEVTCRDFFK